MKRAVVIVGGGKGVRFGSDVPKQFLDLNGQPVLFHTINRFVEAYANIEVVLVLPENQLDHWNNLNRTALQANSLQIVTGGPTRFDSVKNGLKALGEEVTTVAIHDAVRPLVSIATIQSAFHSADLCGCGIPVIELASSLRQMTADGSITVDRSEFRAVQTPQCFDRKLLDNAYSNTLSSNHTDDASVFQAAGYTIHLVDGNPENIKITTPSDLLTAHALMNQ